jgi:hypothetical protein
MKSGSDLPSLRVTLTGSALLVFNWREKIIELLKSPIDAEKDLPASGEGQDVVDPENEYYAQALKFQGQGEFYIIRKLRSSRGIPYCLCRRYRRSSRWVIFEPRAGHR